MLGEGGTNLQMPTMFVHPLLTISGGFSHVTLWDHEPSLGWLFGDIRLGEMSFVVGDQTGHRGV